MKKRHIVVFTGTRAEYGLLRRIIGHLAQNATVRLDLLVSGTHLSERYGHTLDEIRRDNFVPIHELTLPLEDNSPLGICQSMGAGMGRYGRALAGLAPDLLIVLGDRYETFCAAAAATMLRIPIAHLYGGATTEGAIDEALRHAITKMSHLHFTSCEKNRERIIQMGEDPARVWNVGSTGVENATLLPVAPESQVRAFLNIPPSVPYVVVTYHPVTLEGGDPVAEVEILVEALCKQKGLYLVFTGTNADAGGSAINARLERLVFENSNIRFFLSLGFERYVQAVRHSKGVVGNSSSGLLEVPSLGVPVLDIGDRQKGRERADSVLHCKLEVQELSSALEMLLSPESRHQARLVANKQINQCPSQEMARIISDYPLTGILKKHFYSIS